MRLAVVNIPIKDEDPLDLLGAVRRQGALLDEEVIDSDGDVVQETKSTR
jgi:hypothetical protein